MSELAFATIASLLAAPGLYQYSLTLDDTGSTSIGTFWFAWVPGEDFLGIDPSSIAAPAGWTATVTNAGAGDGYAIRFTANSSASYLMSGSSLSGFSFTSSETPAALAGNSPFFPATPQTTSFVYSAAPFSDPGFELTAPVVTAPSPIDFNADRMADILFVNTDGTYATWTLNGTTITGGATLGDAGAGLVYKGIGDFNDDGTSDILFENVNTGVYATWDVPADSVSGGGTIGAPGVDWVFKAIGDFNGTGNSDVLFENTATGVYATWDIRGTSIVGGGNIGAAGGSWEFAGIGDFNGDGFSDILFQDASNDYAVWEIGDNKVIGGGVIGTAGTEWSLKGTGDFNGDGKSDLLFENVSGELAIWDLNGVNVIGGGNIGNPGAGWNYQAIADLSGDNHADIVFQSTTNSTLATWEMNNTAVIAGATIGDAGSAWRVLGI